MLRGRLVDLFGRFEQQGIGTLVLRNHETLPDYNMGTDVDLVIRACDLKRVTQLVRGWGDDQDLVCVGGAMLSYVRVFRLADRRTGEALKLDFFLGESWRGINLFSADELIARRRVRDGVPVISRIDEAAICWLHPLLFGAMTKPRYHEMIVAVAREHRQELATLLRPRLGQVLTERCVAGMVEGRLDSLLAYRRPIIARIVSYGMRSPMATIDSMARNVGREILRRLDRPGYRIISYGSGAAILRAQQVWRVLDSAPLSSAAGQFWAERPSANRLMVAALRFERYRAIEGAFWLALHSEKSPPPFPAADLVIRHDALPSDASVAATEVCQRLATSAIRRQRGFSSVWERAA
ncbi:MAG: hypothetical protein KC503_29650 [Myxococcales bacterium]|nr:hypothetical protein [Myxococcales bacterium]